MSVVTPRLDTVPGQAETGTGIELHLVTLSTEIPACCLAGQNINMTQFYQEYLTQLMTAGLKAQQCNLLKRFTERENTRHSRAALVY